MPRGKKPLDLPKEKLAQAIADAEKDGPLASLGTLWYTVGRSLGIGSSTAANYAKKYGLTYITQGVRPIGGSASRARTKSNSPEAHAHYDALKRAYEAKYQPLVRRVKAGSLVAAIKLKCLDCCCFQKEEVRNCTSIDCALWLRRPYKTTTLENEDAIEDNEETAEDG